MENTHKIKVKDEEIVVNDDYFALIDAINTLTKAIERLALK